MRISIFSFAGCNRQILRKDRARSLLWNETTTVWDLTDSHIRPHLLKHRTDEVAEALQAAPWPQSELGPVRRERSRLSDQVKAAR